MPKVFINKAENLKRFDSKNLDFVNFQAKSRTRLLYYESVKRTSVAELAFRAETFMHGLLMRDRNALTRGSLLCKDNTLF